MCVCSCCTVFAAATQSLHLDAVCVFLCGGPSLPSPRIRATVVDVACFPKTSWISMTYAPAGRRSVNLSVILCLPLTVTLGCLMCLCHLNAPPPDMHAPLHLASPQVCAFVTLVLLPAPPADIQLLHGVFVSCYSISFLSLCMLFLILKADKWDSLCLFLSLFLTPVLYPPSPPLPYLTPLCISCPCLHSLRLAACQYWS